MLKVKQTVAKTQSATGTLASSLATEVRAVVQEELAQALKLLNPPTLCGSCAVP
jgi:hypothetical protein